MLGSVFPNTKVTSDSTNLSFFDVKVIFVATTAEFSTIAFHLCKKAFEFLQVNYEHDVENTSSCQSCFLCHQATLSSSLCLFNFVPFSYERRIQGCSLIFPLNSNCRLLLPNVTFRSFFALLDCWFLF